MLAIDIQKKSDGKHVISWEVDSLDRILDELGVYEGNLHILLWERRL